MSNTINAATLALNSAGEQCRLVAYDDKHPDKVLTAGDTIEGTLTIGWGHTGPGVYIGETWTQADADTQRMLDLQSAERAVQAAIIDKVALTDNQFGATADFIFNVGVGNFAASRLRKLLVKGDLTSIPAEFGRWVYAKGVKEPGLVKRRAMEAHLFTTPDAATVNLGVADATSLTPDAVKQPSAFRSVTMAGAALAGSAPLIAPIFQQGATDLQPLVDYGHSLKIMFLALSVCGAGLAMYGRLSLMHKQGI